jgi:hypothetical protein
VLLNFSWIASRITETNRERVMLRVSFEKQMLETNTSNCSDEEPVPTNGYLSLF